MITFLQANITPIFTFLTLCSNIVFVAVMVGMIISREFREKVYDFVYKHVLSLLFTASLIAVIGSLSYSEIVGFLPCDLCWIQRIFMYPQAILAFIAMRRKDRGIIPYLLSLSIFGIIVATYHSLVHWRFISGSILKCTAGDAAPCAKVYVLSYGYITIPFMAFTVFAYLITISVIYYLARRRNVVTA